MQQTLYEQGVTNELLQKEVARLRNILTPHGVPQSGTRDPQQQTSSL